MRFGEGFGNPFLSTSRKFVCIRREPSPIRLKYEQNLLEGPKSYLANVYCMVSIKIR